MQKIKVKTMRIINPYIQYLTNYKFVRTVNFRRKNIFKKKTYHQEGSYTKCFETFVSLPKIYK